jgi:hypothetical protein
MNHAHESCAEEGHVQPVSYRQGMRDFPETRWIVVVGVLGMLAAWFQVGSPL